MMNAALINNRYRILETLGRGGFGETYLVEDLHMPSGRKCVLKQLKPIVQQPSIPLWMKERFQREAAILEELGAASNQIPELYAYFSENEQFYLVQEWIEGETLAQKWERQGKLTDEEVVAILSQIIPVLDFVHSRKIVHRDIKPENIIIRSSDRVPVLIDFGAVKEAMVTTVVRESNSAFSAAIGTPGYMPSEQAAGRPVYSSDLYSLSLTAIFLLTGKTPQELEIDSQTGEIVWQKYAEDIDPHLVAVLTQAISFHPRDRFVRGEEMLIALQSNPHYLQSHQNTAKTTTTVKVAPRRISGGRNSKNYYDTVAYDDPHSQRKKGKFSWLKKLVFFFLIAGGVTVGSIATSFYVFSNWWQSRPRSAPQVKIEPTFPRPVTIPPGEETTENPEDIDEKNSLDKERERDRIIKIGDLYKPKKAENQTNEHTEKTVDKEAIPEVVIAPKPQPKTESRSQIDVPIITTGTSESKLVSTLGKPTYQRNEPRNNSKVLTYRNNSFDNVNLTYHSDSNGKIKQADISLNQDLSLGAMQETLARLLGGNASADAKNKLRDVYNRQSDRYSFRSNNLQGSIYRDSKDRVNISVWEL